MTSHTSVAPVALFAGVRHAISEVERDTMSQDPEHIETLGASTVSNPVPVIMSLVPPPKLPLAGSTEDISREEVNVASLQDSPWSELKTVT